MQLLDGRVVSKNRLEKLKVEISEHSKKVGRAPTLVVVRVGDDPASHLYVQKKIKTCGEVGIHSEELHLTASTSEKELLDAIQVLNARTEVDGILVQLPLPSQIRADLILEAVAPEKDVDGFHPLNLGRLLAQDPRAFVACTPLGIMRMLEHYEISVRGKFAVVMGRSRIVGRPMSLLLDHAGASVCVVHSQTPDAKVFTRQADILVVAIGKPQWVGADHVKEGACVIDVGTHRTADAKVVGDTRFEEIKAKVSAISPVPGGVGPMTICSLLENSVKAFKWRTGF